MCFLLKLDCPGIAPARAGAITREAAAAGVLELRAERRPKGSDAARFSASEQGQGCGCTLLEDDADWRAPHWALRPEVREPMVRTVEFLLAQGAERVVLDARWLDGAWDDRDAPPAVPMRLDALAGAIRAGRLPAGRTVASRPPGQSADR